MDKITVSHMWSMRLWFFLLAALILFLHLLPLETQPRRWSPPDLLIAVIFAWSVRRPDFVPPLSIAAVMLMADLLLQRPPGLLALLVLLGSEFLKSRNSAPGETSFAAEWASVSLAIVAIALLYRLILSVLLVEQAPLTLSLMQAFMTILVYPVIAMVSQSVLGVRRLTAGEAETMGLRR